MDDVLLVILGLLFFIFFCESTTAKQVLTKLNLGKLQPEAPDNLLYSPILISRAPPDPLPPTQAPISEIQDETEPVQIPKEPNPNVDPNVRYDDDKPLVNSGPNPWVDPIPTNDDIAAAFVGTGRPTLFNDQVLCSSVSAETNPKRWQSFSDVEWCARRPDVPSVYLPYEAPCEIGKKPDKYWRGDLNNAISQYSTAANAHWDPYKHLKSKQLWMQYLSKDMESRRDPYCRWVRTPVQQQCAQKVKAEDVPETPSYSYEHSANTINQ